MVQHFHLNDGGDDYLVTVAGHVAYRLNSNLDSRLRDAGESHSEGVLAQVEMRNVTAALAYSQLNNFWTARTNLPAQDIRRQANVMGVYTAGDWRFRFGLTLLTRETLVGDRAQELATIRKEFQSEIGVDYRIAQGLFVSTGCIGSSSLQAVCFTAMNWNSRLSLF